MKSIKIENLRSLKNTSEIDLKRLNILLGKNSIGKSSFLRSFILLKQSLLEKVDSPLLWHHEMGVDFGSFDDTVIHDGSDYISFTFKLNPIRLNYFFHGNRKSFKNIKGNTIVKIFIKKNENSINNRVSKFEIELYKSEIICEINKDKTIDNIIINDNNIFEYFSDLKLQVVEDYFNVFMDNRTDGILPFINTEKELDTKNKLNIFDANLLNAGSIKSYIKGNLTKDYKDLYSDKYRIYYPHLLNRYYDIYNDKIQDLKNIDEKKFKSLLLLLNINEIINRVNTELLNVFNNVYYIGPYRAKGERYYRIQQKVDLKFDADGRNIPNYLINLERNNKIEELNTYLKVNFKIEIKLEESNGIMSVKVKDINKQMNDYINISDIGFGFSQLLPIIIILWDVSNNEEKGNKIVLIEQPELHLHPAMQADFIDSIMKILEINKNIKFIIETHSEKIINRIGVYVEMKKVNSEDINVLIFNQSSNNVTKISQTEYNDRGGIKEWPEGFFQPNINLG